MPIIEKKLYKQATPNGIQVEYLVRRTVEPGGDVRIHLDATILESGGRWALGHVSLPVSVWGDVVKDFPIAADLGARDDGVRRRLLAQIELYGKEPAETKVDAEEVGALLKFIKGGS